MDSIQTQFGLFWIVLFWLLGTAVLTFLMTDLAVEKLNRNFFTFLIVVVFASLIFYQMVRLPWFDVVEVCQPIGDGVCADGRLMRDVETAVRRNLNLTFWLGAVMTQVDTAFLLNLVIRKQRTNL